MSDRQRDYWKDRAALRARLERRVSDAVERFYAVRPDATHEELVDFFVKSGVGEDAVRLEVMDRTEEIRTAPRDDQFVKDLAEVRDSGLFTMDELAVLAGVSRARLFQILPKRERS
jgi:hypothetical protein